jgi:hypothetical protein
MVRSPSSLGVIASDPPNFRFHMHSASIPLIIALAASGAALAGVPEKAPIARYQSLWLASPFTAKPTCELPPEAVTAHDDFTLGGVSPIPGGYRVTIFPKTGNLDRILLDSGETVAGIAIHRVEFNAADPLDTVVYLKSGALTAPLRFDRQALDSKSQPASAPAKR